MLRRYSCRTLAYAVELWRSFRAQGYSPSLLASDRGFEVCVWPVIVLALALQGCIPKPNNEELVKRAKVCFDAGMSVRTIEDMAGLVMDFQCVPKDSK